MGKIFYVKHWMGKGDDLIRDLLHRSLLATIYDPEARLSHAFDDLLLSHPGIVITEYALSQTLIAEGIYPAEVFGVSVGEVTPLPFDHFWGAASKPMRFQDTLSANRRPEHFYQDLGLYGTLVNFIKYNLGQEGVACSSTVLTPMQGNKDRLTELKNRFAQQ